MASARTAGEPILPGSTIGIVGGGQLGRMFAVEARRMGYRVVVLDPSADAPAAQISDQHLRAPFDDAAAVRELGRRCHVVTLEWENADVGTLRALEELVPVRPGPGVLAVAQHRVREKDAARRLGVP
ncbi:MAG TPA: NAD(P)-dependent oxidoreductase, partial [Longimicrobiaceae bacterium]|nr:NAD(P)-dependent oxidoreductase [Longimicrobiaceae bacterium]